jgi:altronate dehydratase large subunit
MKREADEVSREEIDLSELILGLECGGSDPTSGISANVVLGRVCDEIIDLGGTALLSETPEAIGAEHLLEKRGRTPEIGRQLRDAVVQWEKAFFAATGEDIRASNPSPGNKAAGITTLSEKSLGCIHKSGTRPLDGLIRYGGIADKKGLYFLDATAYDVVNVTAIAAAGAQLVAFTTGLGNPIGNPIVPVVKITGNRDTATRLGDIIDVDTSASLSGEKTVDTLAGELLATLLRVCAGEAVRAEENGACEIAVNQNHTYA